MFVFQQSWLESFVSRIKKDMEENMKLVVFSCVLAVFTVGASASSDVASFMKHLEVIPDVINEAPKDFLTVST